MFTHQESTSNGPQIIANRSVEFAPVTTMPSFLEINEGNTVTHPVTLDPAIRWQPSRLQNIFRVAGNKVEQSAFQRF